MSALLEVDDLTVRFRGGGLGLDQVSLAVAAGETVGVVGESGSGKTTLGRAVLGLVKPTAGRLLFRGQEIRAAGQAGERNRIQMVFQDPGGSLNPARTVGYSVAEPMLIGGQRDRAHARARARELLAAVGLPEDAVTRYPHEFSGGQRQRIAIARALAADPELIVCDEPTSALDLSTQAQMLNLLTELKAAHGLSYLFISHDLAVVRHMADRVVVLYRGRVMEDGPAQTVSAEPLHPYSCALRLAAPVADVEAQRQQRTENQRINQSVRGLEAQGRDGCPFVGRCAHAAPVCVTLRPRLTEVGDVSVACHMYDPASGHTGPDSVEPQSALVDAHELPTE